MSALPYEIITISERLRLVQLRPDQADRLFWLTDSNREYLARFLPWVEHTLAATDSRDFIERKLGQRKNGEEYGYGIEYDGEIVGHSSLMIKDKKIPEIGYWISADYQGKGITTEVAMALTQLALDTLQFNDVIIRAEPANLGSNRVAEKCGYHRDGTVKEDGKTLNLWKKSRS